jgi:hypothetical protein
MGPPRTRARARALARKNLRGFIARIHTDLYATEGLAEARSEDMGLERRHLCGVSYTSGVRTCALPPGQQAACIRNQYS